MGHWKTLNVIFEAVMKLEFEKIIYIARNRPILTMGHCSLTSWGSEYVSGGRKNRHVLTIRYYKQAIIMTAVEQD
jgi:predicted nucleic acid-binding Zn finger protein